MNIIDTYSDVESLFIGKAFDRETWRKYANAIEPNMADIIEKDSANYDYSKDILPVINKAINSYEKLNKLHQSFLKVTKKLQERTVEVFGGDLEVDIILYLGLCNGAGWATEVNGRNKVLLGIEKILELDWYNENNLVALIFHELGHIWHYSERKLNTEIVTQSHQSVWKLYTEGVAMYCEQLLYNNERFFHQNINGWLKWCDSNKDILISEYKQRITKNEGVQEFFGDWCSFMEHSDLGYYLGAEFIRNLAKKYSLNDIANLELRVITEEFFIF